MGKLKQYETSKITMTGMGQLSDAPFKEAQLSNQRVDAFLSSVGKTFFDKANVYAQDQAIKDAIASPITKEQIEQAKQTGGNPIEKFLTGGTTYNDAKKQVLGQQVAGELRLELDQASANILEQVRLGNITNQGEALEQLREPISAHGEFLSNIDPKLAEGYGAQATASAHNYLNQADTIIRNREEDKRQYNAQVMLENVVRDYQNFLLANPNMEQAKRDAYKDVIRKMARDTSFSLTKKQEAFSEQLDEALEYQDNGYYAKALAQKYRGKTIKEVIEALPNDQSVEASYYMQSVDKEAFARQINNELTYVNSEIAARDKIALRQLNEINKNYIAEGVRIPPAVIKEMYDLVEPGSELYETIDEMVKQSNEIELLNKEPLPNLIAELEDLQDRFINPDEDLSVQENQRRNLLQPYVNNMMKALKNDAVGLMGKRDGSLKELDLNSPTLAQDVLERKQLVERNAERYGFNDMAKDVMIFTKSEVDQFVNTYMASDANTRVAMLQIIDNEFGADNSAALLQLVQGGLPTTAELSSYFANPTLTSKLMSFDDEEEQKRLNTVAKERGYSYNDFRKEIANAVSDFENVVLANTPFSNRSIATQKLDNVKDALTYLAIHEMQTGNLSLNSAVKKAAAEFSDKFDIQDTYYVPKIYNGKEIDPEPIVIKAERIKDIHLADFNAVPFGSFNEIIDPDERDLEFRTQMVENGKWQVTADGTGLIFGITMQDGSFGPVQNAEGRFLTFKFDDTSMTVPFTNVDITVPKGETVIERRGRTTRARERLTMSADELRILQEKKARGKRVFGVE